MRSNLLHHQFSARDENLFMEREILVLQVQSLEIHVESEGNRNGNETIMTRIAGRARKIASLLKLGIKEDEKKNVKRRIIKVHQHACER